MKRKNRMGSKLRKQGKAAAPRRKPLIEALEPRLLLSADLPLDILQADVVPDINLPVEPVISDIYIASPESISGNMADVLSARHEIVFVDPALQEVDKLLQDLGLVNADGTNNGVEVVRLNAVQDGIQQITDVLAGKQGVTGMHVLSHGSSGNLKLGSGHLNSDNLAGYSEQLTSWGNALTTEADILLYGCSIADGVAGVDFVNDLARITGADVAASVDNTGNLSLGANWVLESSTGLIESPTLATNNSSSYDYLLAPLTFIDDGAGNITVTGTAGIDDVVLENNATAGQMTVRTADSTWSQTFSVAGLNTLTLDLGNGDDILTLDSFDDAFAGSLSVSNGAGIDEIAVKANAAISSDGGNISLASDKITVNAGALLSTRVISGNDHKNNASTGNSGSINLIAPEITIGDGASLLTHVENGSAFGAGDISMFADAGYALNWQSITPFFKDQAATASISVGSADLRAANIFASSKASTAKYANFVLDEAGLEALANASLRANMVAPGNLIFQTNGSAADSILRTTGDWVADGFQAGMFISISGTVDNDGIYRVGSVSALELTLASPTLSGNPNLTFADNGANADTITRATGSWINDGFMAGQQIQVSDTASNNKTFTIASVTDTEITLVAEDALVAESKNAVTVVVDEVFTENTVGGVDTVSINSLAGISLNTALTFADNGTNPDTITRATGSWIADGFKAGQIITVEGSASNNKTLTIESLTASTLTLKVDDGLANETGSAIRVTGEEILPGDIPLLAVDDAGNPISGTFTAGNISNSLLQTLGSLGLFDLQGIGAQVVLANTSSTITIGNGANLSASNNITLQSEAENAVTLKTPSLVLGVTYTESSATSKSIVESGATLTAGNLFRMVSNVNNSMTATTKVMSGLIPIPSKPMQIPAPALSVTYGKGTSVNEAGVKSGATVNAGSVDVDAVTNNDFLVSTKSSVLFPGKNQGNAIAVSISEARSTADAYLSGNVAARTNIEVDARSVNANNDVEAKAAVKNKLPGQAALKKAGVNLASKFNAKADPGSFGATGSLVIGSSTNTATASIGDGATVNAGGNLNIRAYAEDNFRTIAAASSGSGAKVSIGGAVSVSNYNNTANAVIGDNATVNASGLLNVDAQAIIPDQVNFANDLAVFLNFSYNFPAFDSSSPEAFYKSAYAYGSEGILQTMAPLQVLKTYLPNKLISGKLATSYAAATAKSGNKKANVDGKLGISGSVNILDVANNANARIGEGANVNTNAAYDKHGQAVKVNAKAHSSTLNFGGIKSPLSPFGVTGGDAAAGGTYTGIRLHNNARAYIDDGARVEAVGNVDVLSDTSGWMLTLTEQGGKAEKYGVSGAFSWHDGGNTSMAWIEETANVVSGGNVTVDASNSFFAINIAGVLTQGGKAAVGLGGALNTITNTTKGFIGDFETSSITTAGSVTATGDLKVEATSNEQIYSFGIAATHAKGANATPDDDPLDGESLPNLFGEAPNEDVSKAGGFGLSGSVAVNLIADTTEAFIANGVTINTNNLTINANVTSFMLAVNGAVAFNTSSSGAGIAGSFVANQLTRTTKAYTNGVKITANDVTVTAGTSDKLLSISAGVSGSKLSKTTNITGSGNLNLVTSHTEAAVGDNTMLTNTGKLKVWATGKNDLLSIAGAIAVTGGAAAGAAADIGIFDTDVLASIGNDANVNSTGDIDVRASAEEDILSVAASIGVSTKKFGLVGSASVYIQNTNVQSTIGNNSIVHTGGSLLLNAVDDNYGIFIGGGVAGGKTAGFGAAAATSKITRTVKSTIGTSSTVTADFSTPSTIVVGAETINGIRLNANKIDNLYLIAGAGAVSGKTVAGAFSLALNFQDSTTEASIGSGATVTQNGSSAGVKLTATGSNNVLTVAGSLAGSGGTAAVGGAAATNDVDDDYLAHVNGSVIAAGDVDIIADASGSVLSIAVGGAGAKTVGVAGTVTVNLIKNDIKAYLTGGSISSSSGHVDLSATDGTTISSLAGAVAGGGKASLGAAVAVNELAVTVSAYVAASNVTSTLSRVRLNASTTSTIRAIAAAGAGAGNGSLAGAVTTNQIDNSVDAHISGPATVRGAGKVSLTATDGSTIESLAGAVSGAGTASAGASVAYNNIGKNGGNHITSYISGSTVRSINSSVELTAKETSTIKSIAAGGAGSGTFSLGGAVTVNDIDSVVESKISGNSDVDAATTSKLEASDNSTIKSLAGQVTISGTAAVGAAVATNKIGTQVNALVSGGTVDISAGGLDVSATSGSTIESLSAGASVSGQVSLTGSVSTNIINGKTDAHISNSATVNARNNIGITATDTSTIRSLAGQVTVGLGAAGIGGSAAYNEIGRTITSYIDGSTVTSTQDSISMTGRSTATIETIAAGGSIGLYAGVAGSVAVNLMANNISSYINNSTVTANDNLLMLAESDNTIKTYGGSLGAGLAGIGGTVTVTTLDNQTRAYINKSAVAARGNGGFATIKRWNGDTAAESLESIRGLSVIASATDNIEQITVTAGLGAGGIAGNVSVISGKETTEAYIAASNVNSNADFGQAVKVKAHQDTRINNKGGSIAGGGVAVAAAVDTVSLRNTTRAFISDRDASGSYAGPAASNVYGRDIEVSTQTYEKVQAMIGGAAISGTFSAGGSVSVVDMGNANEAWIQGSNTWSLGSLTVQADDIAIIDTDVGVISGSLTASAGASVAVNSISSTTRANLRGAHVNAAGATMIKADSDESITTDVATGAIGGVAGMGGSVTVNAIGVTTEALVDSFGGRSSQINQDARFQAGGIFLPGAGQHVTISVDDTASIRNWGGSVSGGILGAVGATVDVGSIKNRTVARVGQQSQVYGRGNFALTANSDRLMSSTVKAYSGGFATVNGAISVLSMGSPIDSAGANEFNSSLRNNVNNDIRIDTLNLDSGNSTAQKTQMRASAVPDPSINGQLGTSGGVGNKITAAYVEDAASAGNRAVITAGGSLNIIAQNKYDVEVRAGSGAGGALSIGVSVANVKIDNVVKAFAGNFSHLSSGSVLKISARDLPKAGQSGINLTAGSGGLIAGAGANGKLVLNTTTQAWLGNDAAIANAGAVTIEASQQSDIDARNSGGTGGLIAGADMRSTTRVTTNVDAFTGTRAVIGSSGQRVGSVNITASSNNRAESESKAVAGGAVAGVGTYANALITPDVDAHIGTSSQVWTSGNTSISSSNINDVDARVNGDFGGAAAFGVLDADARINNATSQARTLSGARIDSNAGVSFGSYTGNTSYARAGGGGGGLIAGAAQTAESIVNNVKTKSIVGNGTVIRADGKLDMKAESRADIDAITSISSGGGISVLEVTSRAQLLDSDTEVRLEGNSNVNVDEFSAQARDIDINVNADGSSTNISVGNSSKATADTDLQADALVFMGSGSSILAPKKISMIARQDSIISRARAATDTTGVQGALTSTADNNQTANSTVRTQAGTSLETRDLYILANSPKNQFGGFIKDAKADAETLTYYVKEIIGYACRTIFGWLGVSEYICDPIEALVEHITASPVDTYTPGSKNVNNLVDFNSNVKLIGGGSPELIVDTSGAVIKAEGITYTNLADRIIVNDIINTSNNKIFIRSVNDSVIGNANFNINNAFESVKITNNSTKDMVINDIEVINKNQVDPLISIGDETSGFNYSVNTNANASLVDIRNTNLADAWINLNGHIENDLGVTRVTNAGGDITSTSSASYIDTRDLTLRADSGAVGTEANRIYTKMRTHTLGGLSTLLRDATGKEGVWLDMTAVSRDNTLLNVLIQNASSSNGKVDIHINDSLREKYGTLMQVNLQGGTSVTGTLFEDDAFNPATSVDIGNNIVDLGFTHGLQDGDIVTYNSNGGAAIGGLRSGQNYAVKVIDGTRIQLARVFTPASVINNDRETITFAGNHGYANGDRVIYSSNGGTAAGGLVDGQAYYVRVISGTAIKLVNSVPEVTAVPTLYDFLAGAVSGNDIDLGVNHGYTTGQAVTYTTSGTAVAGVSAGNTYYVVVVDATTIQLAATKAAALAATPTVIALNTTGASGDHGISALVGIDLDSSVATGAGHALIMDLQSGATGANHTLRGDSYYIRDTGGSIVRIKVADIVSGGLVNTFGSAPANGVFTVNTVSGLSGVTIAAGSSDSVTTDLVLTDLISSNNSVSLSSVAGNITRSGAGQLIQAPDISLVAGKGAIGQSGSYLQTDVGTGKIDATALGDIYLDERTGDMRVGSITSTNGNIFLTAAGSIVDADSDASSDVTGGTVNLVARNGRIGSASHDLDINSDALVASATAGIDITETAGNLNITRASTTAGDASFTATAGNININRILAVAGGTVLDAFGSILDSHNDAVSNIDSRSFTMTARNGSIGTSGNDIDVNVTAAGLALFSATAAQGIYARSTTGGLNIQRATSTNGNIRLTISDQAIAGNNLLVGATGIIRADNGTVLLNVGDNITITVGGEVRASGTVTLAGDYGNADIGTGTIINIQGKIYGSTALVSGNVDNDFITLTNVTAGTETTVKAGAGNDVINTGVSDAASSLINSELTLDGETGSDTYNIDLARSGAAVINVLDSGAAGTDNLNIDGTTIADQILLRKLFVASLHGADVERVNYNANINGTMTINSLAGDDRFNLDDNSAVTVINMGAGKDKAQIGQMFKTPRVATNVAPGDEIETTATTRGYLSKGISMETTINGGADDDNFQVYHNGARLNLNGDGGSDTFVVRAFATTNTTAVAGGDDSDYIEYAVNAPVDVDGGDGADTLVVVGTEFADKFVITNKGVFGAGLNINYSNIESVDVDGMEGDDQFYVQSTQSGSVTRIFGGYGNDTIHVGADVPAGVVAKDEFGNPIVFPDIPQTVNNIAGPLYVFGGLDPEADRSLVNAVILPTETDVGTFPTIVPPSPEDDVDTLNVLDQDSTANDVGMLTSTRLTGLGMGGDQVIEGKTYNGGITYQDFEALNINLGSGTDTLTVESTHTGTTGISLGAGNDTINIKTVDGVTTVHGDAGNDTFNVTHQAPTLGGGLTTSINKDIHLFGDADSDRLNVDDSGETRDTRLDLTESTLDIEYMAGTINYGTMEDIYIDSGSGNDIFNITGTQGGAHTRANTHNGNDVINVASNAPTLAGTLDNIAGQLSIDAGSGDNTLNVSDVDSAVADGSPAIPVVINRNSITGMSAGRINYVASSGNYAGGINIWAGKGSDTVTIGSARSGDVTSVWLNDGDDAVTVTDDNSGTDGLLVLFGENGSDTLDASGWHNDMIVFGDFGSVNYNGTIGIYKGSTTARKSNPGIGYLGTAQPGSGGNDVITTGNGDNRIFGGFGADSITTGSGEDRIIGDNGEFSYLGGNPEHMHSTDSDSSTGGDDIINAGDGRDLVIGGVGGDTINGEGGNDYIIGDNGEFFFLQTGQSVVLKNSGDVLTGDGDPDSMDLMWSIDPALGGSDTIDGGTGDDYMIGGAGNDLLLGQADEDMLSGDGAQMVFSHWKPVIFETIDPFIGGDDELNGGADRDIMLGGFGGDLFHGNLGEDVMIGEYARVTLDDDRGLFVVRLGQGNLDIIGSTQFGLYSPQSLEHRFSLGGTPHLPGVSGTQLPVNVFNEVRASHGTSHPGEHTDPTINNPAASAGNDQGGKSGKDTCTAEKHDKGKAESGKKAAKTQDGENKQPLPADCKPSDKKKDGEGKQVDDKHSALGIAVAGLSGWRVARRNRQKTGSGSILNKAGFEQLAERDRNDRVISWEEFAGQLESGDNIKQPEGNGFKFYTRNK